MLVSSLQVTSLSYAKPVRTSSALKYAFSNRITYHFKNTSFVRAASSSTTMSPSAVRDEVLENYEALSKKLKEVSALGGISGLLG